MLRFFSANRRLFCVGSPIRSLPTINHGHLGAPPDTVVVQMRSAQRSKNKRTIIPIDVVVTICSNRKFRKPIRAATPSALSRGTQEAVSAQWIARIRKLRLSGPASDIYAGRAFGLAREAAETSSATFYILSAGLGIVSALRNIPAYGLTISAGYEQSITRKVFGSFDPAEWFSSLLTSAYSDKWDDVASQKSGRILVALSRPYAEMVGSSLAATSPKMFDRLRIFGVALETALPVPLHAAIAPYDERLNSILPGTRVDFAQRALFHFAQTVAVKPSSGREDDFAAVRSALKDHRLPRQVQRLRTTDDQIVAVIKKRLRVQTSATRMLIALRHDEGIACEQSRFSRLYRVAAGKREAQ